MKKTIEQINAAHAERASGMLNGFLDERNRIRDEERLEDSPYLHRLTPEQRFAALQSQKTERVAELRRSVVEDYRAEVLDYHARLAHRREELEEELFGGGLDSRTLAAAASADDDALPRILQAAIAAGDAELARAAFVAAETRGLSEVTLSYLQADPEAREVYRELKSIPSEEVRERQLDVERVVPEVESERLMGTPRGAS